MKRVKTSVAVAGAGLTGATIARVLAEKGHRVLVYEKRNHVAGNAHDTIRADGTPVHTYGPHIFHTNNAEIYGWLGQFTSWVPYRHRVEVNVEGTLYPMPVTMETVERLLDMTFSGPDHFSDWIEDNRCDHLDPNENSETAIRSQMCKEIFEKIFKGYTRKMWGVPASKLDASVCRRIPIRADRSKDYFTDTYQALPGQGYTAMVECMLDHPNIEVFLGVEIFNRPEALVWTGPIDAYYGNDIGRLPYRSLDIQHHTVDITGRHCLPVATVNEADVTVLRTRTTDFTHLRQTPLHEGPNRAPLAVEYPCAHVAGTNEPYYPVPSKASRELYRQYAERAKQEPGVWFAGRLGTYRYMNMDACVGSARKLAHAIAKHLQR